MTSLFSDLARYKHQDGRLVTYSLPQWEKALNVVKAKEHRTCLSVICHQNQKKHPGESGGLQKNQTEFDDKHLHSYQPIKGNLLTYNWGYQHKNMHQNQPHNLSNDSSHTFHIWRKSVYQKHHLKACLSLLNLHTRALATDGVWPKKS